MNQDKQDVSTPIDGPDPAAGYKSAIELRSWMGTTGRVAEGMQQIYAKQFQYHLEDHAESMRQLASFTPPVAVWLDYMNRRSVHNMEGWREASELLHDTTVGALADRARRWNDATAQNEDLREGRGDLIERLHTDHGRLARILSVMEKLIEAPSPEDLDTLGSAIDYVCEYPDAYHHPREDQLFGRLLEKEITEEERELINQLVRSHKELAKLTATVVSEFEAMLASEDFVLADLRDAITDYIQDQRDHMSFEERHVFPLAQKYLTGIDLNDFEPMLFDPVFEQRLTQYESLYASLFGGPV